MNWNFYHELKWRVNKDDPCILEESYKRDESADLHDDQDDQRDDDGRAAVEHPSRHRRRPPRAWTLRSGAGVRPNLLHCLITCWIKVSIY